MFYDLLIFFFFSQLQYLGLGRDVDKLKVLICPLDKRPADLMGGMIGPLWLSGRVFVLPVLAQLETAREPQ